MIVKFGRTSDNLIALIGMLMNLQCSEIPVWFLKAWSNNSVFHENFISVVCNGSIDVLQQWYQYTKCKLKTPQIVHFWWWKILKTELRTLWTRLLYVNICIRTRFRSVFFGLSIYCIACKFTFVILVGCCNRKSCKYVCYTLNTIPVRF